MKPILDQKTSIIQSSNQHILNQIRSQHRYNKKMIKGLLLILLISFAVAQSSSIPADLAAAMTKAGLTPPASTAPVVSAAPAASTYSSTPTAPVTDPNCCQNKDVTSSILIWLINQIVDLKAQLADCCKAKRPQVVRFPPVNLSNPITLHQQSASYSFPITVPPSSNVYALLVEVYYYHSSMNNLTFASSHGYMSARIKQQGDYTNVAQFSSKKFNWYSNSVNELEIIPWRTDLPYNLDTDIYDTYNTEAAGNPYGKNYYQIRLVGYMTF